MSGSTTIIGGADAPTSIFLFRSAALPAVCVIAVVIIAAVAVIMIKKKK